MNKMMGSAGFGRKAVYTADEPGQWDPNGGHVQSLNPFKQKMESEGCATCGSQEYPLVGWEFGGSNVVLCPKHAKEVGAGLLQDSGRAEAIQTEFGGLTQGRRRP